MATAFRDLGRYRPRQHPAAAPRRPPAPGVGVHTRYRPTVSRPLSSAAMAWLPDGFIHPERVDLPTGHHLRPIRAADVDIDYPAVMGSRERLWAKYGETWGWPPATMSYEADREDLARHEVEIA